MKTRINEHGSVPLNFNQDVSTSTPDYLIGGGNHFDDAPQLERCGVSDVTTCTKLFIHVENSHKRRLKVN